MPAQHPEVVLYTRTGCHLCDEALALLRRHGIEPELIEIDQRPELLTEYHECVPVVFINGRVRFRGRVNEMLLQRLLR